MSKQQVSSNQFDPKKIHIEKVSALNIRINSPSEFIVEKARGFELQAKLELGFNLVDKLVKAIVTVNVTTNSQGDNNEEASGVFEYVFIFRIDNLEELAQPEADKTITLKSGLGGILSALAYSTMRGCIIEKVSGTALRDFILPVIAPSDLLSNESK